jgi:hypothetical protein
MEIIVGLLAALVGVGTIGLLTTKPWIYTSFVNESDLSTSDLWLAWINASHRVQDGTNLNAARPDLPEVVVRDSRLITPRAVRVTKQPDIPERPGAIMLGSRLVAGYCSLRSFLGLRIVPPTVVCAESVQASVVEYEFENIILWKLGYDVSNR